LAPGREVQGEINTYKRAKSEQGPVGLPKGKCKEKSARTKGLTMSRGRLASRRMGAGD
jgi:hypothetical protein